MVLRHTSFPLQYADEDENGDIDPAETEAPADFFQGQVFALRRHRLHQLFKGLGVSGTLWNDRAEATFDWPPLQMLVLLHDCLYPQGGISL